MKKILLFLFFTSTINAQTVEFSGGYTRSSLDYVGAIPASDIIEVIPAGEKTEGYVIFKMTGPGYFVVADK